MSVRLVAHCRDGFELEAAADLRRSGAVAGAAIDVEAPNGKAFVVATPNPYDAPRWSRALESTPPIFVRSLFFGTGPHRLFDPATTSARPDRVAPLVAHIAAFSMSVDVPGLRRERAFGELRLETPDTNEGKEMSGLCRAIEPPLAKALRDRGILAAEGVERQRPALHVLFVDGAHVYVGGSVLPWGSRWPMGIPRLRMPRGAPSRSTLKLAEAFVTFLGERASELLRPGMRAVDLGAAPGGWTWQLAQRGVRVTAVDNGALRGEVAQDPLVTHLRADGLTYIPRRSVDWLLCDIVESPSRVATLVARWIAEGHARRAIFNLKLPMKKRYDEARRCESIIRDSLARARVKPALALRQLYHDREEITGFVERIA